MQGYFAWGLMQKCRFLRINYEILEREPKVVFDFSPDLIKRLSAAVETDVEENREKRSSSDDKEVLERALFAFIAATVALEVALSM
eukprot:snap_masked-scaffold_27-processed-gene-1.22-mRNA-1 protein AED:1.00 eAED:1.00 QI:0/0/0/0/1/1/2/0/85